MSAMDNWTTDQWVMYNHWLRYGFEGLPVRKVKGGWIIDAQGCWAPLGNVPKVFKLKREALEFCDNLASIRVKQWRGLEV